MSDVLVPYGDNPADTATLLLAAAEKLKVDQAVVRTTGNGFLVPEEIAKEAGLDENEGADEPTDADKPAEKPAEKPPAKKSTAKK